MSPIRAILFNSLAPGGNPQPGQVTAKSLTSNVATLQVVNSFAVGDWIQITGVGAPFDKTAVQVTARSNTSVSYSDVAANVSQQQATGTVTATSNPNPTGGSTMYGTSGGRKQGTVPPAATGAGVGVAGVAAFWQLNSTHLMRTYTAGGSSFPTTYGGFAQAPNCPANVWNFTSFEPGTDFATNSASRTKFQTLLRNMSTANKVCWTSYHEPDHGPKCTAAQYGAIITALCDDVEAENTRRGGLGLPTNHLSVFTCVTAFGLTTGGSQRSFPYVDAVMGESRIGMHGIDVYTAAQIPLWKSLMNTRWHNVPWCIPELGCVLNEFPADSKFNSEMLAYETQWKATPNPAAGIMWFDSDRPDTEHIPTGDLDPNTPPTTLSEATWRRILSESVDTLS